MTRPLKPKHPAVRWLWRLTVLYSIVLANFLLSPEPFWFLGSTGNSIDDTISREVEDYFQHAGVFILLAGLTCLAQFAGGRPSRAICFAATLAYAVLGEALQAPIPNRYAGFSDGLANVAGVLLGWGGGLLVIRIARWWRSKGDA